jgi:arylsulfatase A-like enzyme
VAKNPIEPLDGVSLIPLFEHQAESRTKPIPFWDHGNGHAAWLDWPYKLHTNPVTTRYHKSKQDGALPVTLLYDVSKDPKETTDLAAQEPERVVKMTAVLQAWKTSVEKSLTGADYGGPTTDMGLKKKNKKAASAEKK